MATKKPIVDYGGKQSEILTTDTIPISNLGTGTPDGTKFLRDDGAFVTPAGGGTPTLTEVEIDFGTKPVNNKTFTITDAGVSNTNKIIVFSSPSNATGQLGNDWEVDSATFSAKANTGNITLYVNTQFSISGKRKIYYQILN
jgi:hypothetical protein